MIKNEAISPLSPLLFNIILELPAKNEVDKKIHRLHDFLCRKSERIDQKNSPGTNKQLQQGCRIQRPTHSYIPAINKWDFTLKNNAIYIPPKTEIIK